MRISFLAPRLPPAVCGVADHTRLLADAMVEQGVDTTFIYCDPGAAPPAALPGPVVRWERNGEPLEKVVAEQQPDWLWIQFSNYGYSRWGAPYRLGRDLRLVRRRMPEVGVAIYLHETHCLPRQLGFKGPVLSPWQKHTVGAVARLGDSVFVSVAPFEIRAIEEYGLDRRQVFRLPIGSNIPPADLTPDHRDGLRRTLGWSSDDTVGVAFGSYATQLRALRRFEATIARGIDEGILKRVVCLGGDPSVVASDLEDYVHRSPFAGRVQLLGPKGADEVGRILSCCDFAFAPTPRPVLEKSGAFMACAFAGLAVLVYSPGAKTDDDLPVLAAESWNWQQASSSRVAAVRTALKKRALSQYTWEGIAQRALAELSSASYARALASAVKV